MKLQYLIDNILSPEIKALSFVDRYGGVVQTLTQEIDDGTPNPKVKSYPVSCYVDVTEKDCANTGMYQNLVPDDSKDSVVYWEVITPMQNAGKTKLNDFHTRKFKGVARLVVWMNIAKLGGTDCRTPFFALAPLEKILSKQLKISGGDYDGSQLWIQPKGMVLNNEQTIFGKYSYPKESVYALYPYGFFAIDVSFELHQCLAKGGIFPANPSIDCPNDTGVDACAMLLDSLTDEQKNECLLPTYDFSNTTVQSNVTGGQQSDLIAWLCTTAPFQNNYSIFFDGLSDRIIQTNDAAYNFDRLDPWTFSFRIEFHNVSATQSIIEKGGASVMGFGYNIVVVAGKIRVILRSGGVGNDFIAESDYTFTNGVSRHVTIKYNGNSAVSGVTVKVDNVATIITPIRDNLTGSIASTSILKIGEGSGYLSATMNVLRCWNIEHSAAQDTADYRGGNPTFPETANQVVGNDMGDFALFGSTTLFGSTNWLFADTTGIVTSSAGVNIPFSGRVTAI
jgi:hypothetical protein